MWVGYIFYLQKWGLFINYIWIINGWIYIYWLYMSSMWNVLTSWWVICDETFNATSFMQLMDFELHSWLQSFFIITIWHFFLVLIKIPKHILHRSIWNVKKYFHSTNQKFSWRKILIAKIRMKKLIHPNSTQGWVELHHYDLGFYWLNLLI
jgi:hypothetical protein